MENTQDLFREEDIRKEKIRQLKEQGINPYADKFEITHSISEALKLEVGAKVKVAGRVMLKRVMGKFAFIKIANVFDRIQVSFSRNELDEEKYTFFKKQLDIGDFVGVEGELYLTQTGELTVRTEKFELLSKAQKPLPEKFHGLIDTEAKYRQRYLDLISNEETRRVFVGRSKLVAFIRDFLQRNDFVEVETPIIQSAVCGANAKPFLTHHNALDKECNLRIAPETYLKQVVCGGFPRVFEVAKCFRNEGMDPSHLQEFTQVEWYASFWNFEDNMKFVTKFFREMTTHMLGKPEITIGEHTYDLSKEFNKVDYTKALSEKLGFDILAYDDVEELKAKVIETNLFDKKDIQILKTNGGVIDFAYKRLVRPTIIEPTFLYNYPACIAPLARPSDANPKVLEMFQFLINGEEICKAYSELVDPAIQRANLEEQAKAKAGGDDEAMDVDEGFLLSMEHGMPPISGLGIGIDRLMVMLYGQASVRDVVLFPIMK
ncbi:MAG: lysine--tRNA ligase [Clostridia bacterium]|nr:lysine--tRNA ligase [Clostridia bacterium]